MKKPSQRLAKGEKVKVRRKANVKKFTAS